MDLVIGVPPSFRICFHPQPRVTSIMTNEGAGSGGILISMGTMGKGVAR